MRQTHTHTDKVEDALNKFIGSLKTQLNHNEKWCRKSRTFFRWKSSHINTQLKWTIMNEFRTQGFRTPGWFGNI